MLYYFNIYCTVKQVKIYIKNYLNPIAACHTKASNKKNTGITGNTSTIGLKIT